MGFLSTVGRGVGSLFGLAGVSYQRVGEDELYSLFGPPPAPRPTESKIVSDVFVTPWRGPLDLDRYGRETSEMRERYRRQYRETPVLRAALRGKADAISCLEVTVLPADKDNKLSCMAAEFLDWTVQQSPRGWRGVIDSVYTPATIDGYSLCEPKLELTRWKGRTVWGLGHLRSLDTGYLRLDLDIYRNVVAIVNLIRGAERYSPQDVILHTHNGMYSNPFGQSDLRAATKAANIIEDVYKVWYIALKVYGLPYMTGKSKPQNKKAMALAMESLREGGYAVTEPEEEIDVVNLAAAAATDGFERMVHTQREDIFFAIRGASLPFLEGDGGQNAHGDANVQKFASDVNETVGAMDVCDTLNRQLVPFLIHPNFGDIDLPRIKLGGTDWKETKDLLDIIDTAKRNGMKPSAEWAYKVTSIPPQRDDQDALVSMEEKQQQQAAAAPPAAPGQPAPAQPPAPAAPAGFSADASCEGPVWLATSRISADPERFQYKPGHDAADGTVRELPAERFDPKKCKPLLCWRDPATGEVFVVDGHHRLAWAERDGVSRVPVKWLAAKTAEEAKELGRRANEFSAPLTFSAEHQPEPARIDAAQIIRVVDALIAELKP